MTRRELACAIANAYATDDDGVVSLLGCFDGVVVLLRDQQEIAFRVLAECQDECEESAIGWSNDRRVWCIVCPEPAAYHMTACRIAEEFHLYEGLDAPLAASAGIIVNDRRDDDQATIVSLASG
ncbi:MAG: hypothetical protein M3552_02130 [Planctomycetota bacterium]|nr:hypothetical protein [Planctomycetota bacterium]